MISFWPAATRLSSLRGKTVRCRPLDNFIATLLRTSRSYTSLSSRQLPKPCIAHNGPRSRVTISAFRAQRFFATRRVITSYNQLPKDYQDETGLDFRTSPLSNEEVRTIFGKGVTAGHANRILRVLHGRRVAGTLDEPEFFPAIDNPYEAKLRQTALKWLRKNVVVDEEMSAGLYAEAELARMEQKVLADSERIGIYKPNSGEHLGEGKSVYGESGLDAIRAAHEAKLDEREQQQQHQDQATETAYNTGTLQELKKPETSVEQRRPGENARFKYYQERYNQSLPQELPDIPAWSRILPSFVVASLVVALSVLFASVYVPPSHAARLWPDMPPAAATCISIITLNAAILCLWRVPPAWAFLNKYFIIISGYPRAISMVGNFFSHQSLTHLGYNMAIIWFIGTKLHDEIGRGNFLALYMSSGVIASLSSLSFFVLSKTFVTSSLGASGPACGILAAYFWLNWDDKFKFFGWPEDPTIGIPGWAFIVCLLGYEAYGAYKGHYLKGKDVFAHLGGMAAGISGAEILRRRLAARKEAEKERRSKMSLADRIKEDRV